MNQIKLTKTKIKDIITNMGKLEPVSSSIVLKGDCMHLIIDPDEVGTNIKKNGVTCVFTFLPLELDGCVFQSNERLDEILKKIRDTLKTAKECFFVFDPQGAGVMLDDVIHPIFHLIEPSNFTNILYEKYQDYVDMVMDVDGPLESFTIPQENLNKLVQSKVVKIDTEFGRIRLSKNNIPLLGSASSSKPANFTISYVVRNIPKTDGTSDCVIALHVNYKTLDAVHLYAVEPY